jgi:hypothetical protein
MSRRVPTVRPRFDSIARALGFRPEDVVTPVADGAPPVHEPLRLRAALEVEFSVDPCRG